jgi:hypothetical protein
LDTGGTGTSQGGVAGTTTDPSGCDTERDVDGLSLTSQSDVEELRGVSRVLGDLRIGGDVTDLRPLSCLTRITVDLHISEAAKLVNVDGLERLTTVNGSLYIGSDCDGGLPAGCIGNPVLENLDGLNNLNEVGQVRIGASCVDLEDGSTCAFNRALARVSFENLTDVGGIMLWQNPALVDVAGFNNVERLTGILIRDSPALERITGFRSLEYMSSDTSFLRNTNLRDLSGFERLNDMGTLTIETTALENLDGFAGVTDLGSLIVSDSPLTSLRGLRSLEEVYEVQLRNTSVTDLSGLERITQLYRLIIIRSPLTSLRGLEQLESVDQELTLAELPLLTDLDPLANVEPPNEINLEDDAVLADLSGLGSISSLFRLKVSRLAELRSLHDLASLTSVADRLEVVDNPKLPSCEAEWLAARVAADPPRYVNLSGNDDGGTCAE